MVDTESLLVGYGGPTTQATLARLDRLADSEETAVVAEEVPIAFVYNARPYTVVMGTPLDLDDLAAGFSVTEGIVANADALERVDVVRASHGIELQIEISQTDAARLSERTRTMASRTGCGLCGVETIRDLLRTPAPIEHTLTIARDALFGAVRELEQRQTINEQTHTVHAAAWADRHGRVSVVREDVGRHNALDKVLGARARAGAPFDDGFIVVTSRASYEMVQKAALFGVELVAAVSRPTGLAIRFAKLSGVTLVGLVRGQTANVYTHAHRIS